MTELRQLTKLVWPFPQSVIRKNPSGGGTYVKHSTVEQRILDVLGPVDFKLGTIIRGHVDAIPPNPDGTSKKAKAGSPALTDAVVGVLATMDAEIDGRYVTITEVGDCEQPHNWSTDGQRLKDAASDAYKRCAMRIGVALHLWSQDDFYLAEKLKRQDETPPPDVDPETGEVAA